MDLERYDLVVVGAGIAGLSLALQARQAGRRVACIEAMMFGGLVVNINHLEPGPDGYQGSGVDLASGLLDQAMEAGVDYLTGQVRRFTPQDEGFLVEGEGIACRGAELALATGARLRRLGVPGERELEHRGVSGCADCDGPLLQDQVAVVVGSGDSALQEARVLADYCRTVHLVMRESEPTGRAALAAAVQACAQVQWHRNTELIRVRGVDSVDAVIVRARSGGEEQVLPCQALFVYVGLEAAVDGFPEALQRDADGFIVTDHEMRTSMPGVFALGAVRAGFGGLLDHCRQDARAVVQALARPVA